MGYEHSLWKKAGQIDGWNLHIVEGTKSHDKEKDEQYVVWFNTAGLGQ